MNPEFKQPYVNGGLKEFHFDSLTEYAQEVDRLHRHDIREPGAHTASRDNSDEWNGGLSFDEALALALDGGEWPEGARDLQQACVDAQADLEQASQEDLALDVIGACIDVGEYLANAPEVFLSLHPHEHQMPVVAIGAELASCGAVNASTIINRGRAILACVDALEANGQRVELLGVISNATRHEGEIRGIVSTITLKAADEPYSPVSLAFALAHPAVSRRLGFRFAEAHDAWITKRMYGSASFNFECADIFFPAEVAGRDYETPEAALETAQTKISGFKD